MRLKHNNWLIAHLRLHYSFFFQFNLSTTGSSSQIYLLALWTCCRYISISCTFLKSFLFPYFWHPRSPLAFLVYITYLDFYQYSTCSEVLLDPYFLCHHIIWCGLTDTFTSLSPPLRARGFGISWTELFSFGLWYRESLIWLFLSIGNSCYVA